MHKFFIIKRTAIAVQRVWVGEVYARSYGARCREARRVVTATSQLQIPPVILQVNIPLFSLPPQLRRIP